MGEPVLTAPTYSMSSSYGGELPRTHHLQMMLFCDFPIQQLLSLPVTNLFFLPSETDLELANLLLQMPNHRGTLFLRELTLQPTNPS